MGMVKEGKQMGKINHQTITQQHDRKTRRRQLKAAKQQRSNPAPSTRLSFGKEPRLRKFELSLFSVSK
jgi:hypothetical protein